MSIEDPLVHLQNEWNYVKGEYQNTKSVRYTSFATPLNSCHPGPNVIFRDQHKEKSLEYHNIQRKCKGNRETSTAF